MWVFSEVANLLDVLEKFDNRIQRHGDINNYIHENADHIDELHWRIITFYYINKLSRRTRKNFKCELE